MRVFIIGVNGFIGNALARAILTQPGYEVVGIDIEKDRLSRDLLNSEHFEFHHGDLSISREWVEFQIKRSDVVFPLAAVAIPRIYVENPLLVFDLDFKENLRVVELAAKYKTRIVFPSTSEVYGMCEDSEFDEEKSNFVLGPIAKHRWIYGCSKQLLDRVIHAYGLQHGLEYTLFRPFNWIGPHLDRIDAKKIGNSRVLTQFISDVCFNRPLTLVDGGLQRRCFLYLDDGIDGLIRILQNRGGSASKRIFNLGNPENECSISDLAKLTVELYNHHPRSKTHPFTAGMNEISSGHFYGPGYEDISSRMPSIKSASTVLGWRPATELREAIRLTLDSFVSEFDEGAS